MSERLARMYAKELFISGTDADFLAAYPYFEAILHDENKSLDEVRVAQCVVSRAARIKNDPDTFFKAALKNVIGEPCAEVCCELGAWYFAAGDWEEAATWYYTAANGVQSELESAHFRQYSAPAPCRMLPEARNDGRGAGMLGPGGTVYLKPLGQIHISLAGWHNRMG
jgi:hypothetical protein